MNIYFKHYSGAIMEYDYMFFDCMAEVTLEEEDIALQKGWLPDDYFIPKNGDRNHWYQARQTRINLKKFTESKSTKKTRKKCEKIQIKTYSRASLIMPNFIDKTIQIYNGKKFIPIKITADMVGHKLGEFAPTRARYTFKKGKK